MIDTTNAVRDRVEETAETLEAADRLRAAIGRLDLPNDAITRAGWAVDDMEGELRRPGPDRDVMASRLWRLTEFLQAQGAVIEVGTPLFAAIAAIAAWVGPLGEALVKRLR